MTPASNLPPLMPQASQPLPHSQQMTGTSTALLIQLYRLSPYISGFAFKLQIFFNYRKVTIEKNLDHFDIIPYAYYN